MNLLGSDRPLPPPIVPLSSHLPAPLSNLTCNMAADNSALSLITFTLNGPRNHHPGYTTQLQWRRRIRLNAHMPCGCRESIRCHRRDSSDGAKALKPEITRSHTPLPGTEAPKH